MKRLFLVLFGIGILASSPSCHNSVKLSQSSIDSLRAEVRKEALWTWHNYKQYALGHDELNPITGGFHDWYNESLLMSAVDALDMLYIMGEKEEADSVKEFLVLHLSFDKNIYVKNFEITIRFLGGLISSYELTGDRRLLDLATDLANRLLPAYNSPTGMPYVMVNLKTGAVRDSITNPAEIGSNILELGTLSKYTGNPVYLATANKSLQALYHRRSSIGLAGEQINVITGKWTNSVAHIGSCIDSYYEYLAKGAILFKDTSLQNMWNMHKNAIDKFIPEWVEGRLWFGRVDMNTGIKTLPLYGALDAYYPALLAFSGDMKNAVKLQESSDYMWNKFEIEPEQFNYKTMQVLEGAYPLRPEIIESAYYLYQYTKDPRYRVMGKQYFEDIRKYCKTAYGYAAIKDVRTKEKLPSMESFLFAETFKYLYLLFSPDAALEFNRVIFTTEAHPLKRD